MTKRYRVTDKKGRTTHHDDINRAISEAPAGATITDTETGQSYKVRK